PPAPGFSRGSLCSATAAWLALPAAYGPAEGGAPGGQAGTAAPLLLPASEFAIALAQRLAAHLVPPRRLPRLDFQAGVPEDARTMVVVPTLLTSVAGVVELVEHVEVLALGNVDPRIHFAI